MASREPWKKSTELTETPKTEVSVTKLLILFQVYRVYGSNQEIETVRLSDTLSAFGDDNKVRSCCFIYFKFIVWLNFGGRMLISIHFYWDLSCSMEEISLLAFGRESAFNNAPFCWFLKFVKSCYKTERKFWKWVVRKSMLEKKGFEHLNMGLMLLKIGLKKMICWAWSFVFLWQLVVKLGRALKKGEQRVKVCLLQPNEPEVRNTHNFIIFSSYLLNIIFYILR